MKRKMAAWIALGIITVVAGLFLSMTNEVTKNVIAQQDADAVVQARKDVLPEADAFEPLELEELAPVSELYVGTKDGQAQGYVGTINVKGYGGPVQVIAGLDESGKVTGVSIGGSDFSETAGLGAKAKDPAFAAQFIGKQSPIKAVKNPADRGDSTIDAITAATITTNAVAGGVNSIASKVDAYLNPPTDVAAEGTTYTASAQGFAGPVAVFVTVKEDGTISALKVGDDQFNETEGFGAGALQDSFTRQFAGKPLPLKLDDIDMISGATITSQAVVDAINKAYDEKNVVAAPAAEGTAYTASEKGFAGPVAVFFTAKDDGTITSMKVGDANFAETEGFGAGALEPAFTKQFVGKVLPLDEADVDGVSGATITTKAVITALNRAFAEKLIDQTSAQSNKPLSTASPAEETKAPSQTTEAPIVEELPPYARLEGVKLLSIRTAFGEAEGFVGPVKVAVGVDAENTLVSVSVLTEGFEETPELGGKVAKADHLQKLLGKALPLSETDADLISGATVTSKALIEAINVGYQHLSAQPDATEEPIATETPKSSNNNLHVRAAVGKSEGFGGLVQVVVVLQPDGTIASVTILEDGFDETQGIGTQVQDPAYLQRYVGLTPPVGEGQVDAIGGATMSSQAVQDAVNDAVRQLGQ